MKSLSMKFQVFLALILVGLLMFCLRSYYAPDNDTTTKNVITHSLTTTLSDHAMIKHVNTGHLEKLRQLLSEKPPERSPHLLEGVEKLLTQPISHDTLRILSEIFQQADMNECAVLISFLEQREDQDSVNLLVSQLHHCDQEISHRAWMACEALAGTIFNSDQEIIEWAGKWEVSPDVQRLMERKQNIDGTAPRFEHPSQRIPTELHRAWNRFDLSK